MKNTTSTLNATSIILFCLLLLTVIDYSIAHEHPPPSSDTSNSGEMSMNMDPNDPYANRNVYPIWTYALGVHAFMMCLLCLIGIPIGIILALQQHPAHKYFQSIIIGLISIAAFIAIIDTQYNGDGHAHSWHAKLGFTLLAFFLFQFVLGWFVKYKNLRYRATINLNPNKSSFHHGVIHFHRLIAVTIVLLIPLTIVFGIVHGTGITPDETEIGNTAAHLGFGGALVVGGLFLFSTFTREQQQYSFTTKFPALFAEYSIWLFFGIVIILTQRDWLKDGFLNKPGVDTQHVLIGVLAVVTCLVGIIFISMSRIGSIQFQNRQLLRIPLFILYLGLGVAMATHTQANHFASIMHLAFGLQVMNIGFLLLFTNNTKLKNFKSNQNNNQYQVVNQFTPNNNMNNNNSLNNNSDPREFEQLSCEKYISLRSLLLVTCGLTFAGSSRYSAIGASKMMHAPIYILMLISIALAIFAWWNVIFHYILTSLEIRSSIKASTQNSSNRNSVNSTDLIKENHNSLPVVNTLYDDKIESMPISGYNTKFEKASDLETVVYGLA